MLRFVQLFQLYRKSDYGVKNPEGDLVNAVNQWVAKHKVRLVEMQLHYDYRSILPRYAIVTYEAEASVAEAPVMVEATLLEYEQ